MLNLKIWRPLCLFLKKLKQKFKWIKETNFSSQYSLDTKKFIKKSEVQQKIIIFNRWKEELISGEEKLYLWLR